MEEQKTLAKMDEGENDEGSSKKRPSNNDKESSVSHPGKDKHGKKISKKAAMLSHKIIPNATHQAAPEVAGTSRATKVAAMVATTADMKAKLLKSIKTPTRKDSTFSTVADIDSKHQRTQASKPELLTAWRKQSIKTSASATTAAESAKLSGNTYSKEPEKEKEANFQSLLKSNPHFSKYIKEDPQGLRVAGVQHSLSSKDLFDYHGSKATKSKSAPLLIQPESESNIYSVSFSTTHVEPEPEQTDIEGVMASGRAEARPKQARHSRNWKKRRAQAEKTSSRGRTIQPMLRVEENMGGRPLHDINGSTTAESQAARCYSLAKAGKPTKPRRLQRLTVERARKVFGNDSKLADAQFDVILKTMRKEISARMSVEEPSQSLSSGSSRGPDLSWLKKFTEADLLVRPDPKDNMSRRKRGQATAKQFSALAPLWYSMILSGRMPFSGEINRKSGRLELTLRRASLRFVIFCLTSFILFLVLALSITSTFLSYDEFATAEASDKMRQDKQDRLSLNLSSRLNGTAHPYTQLELLYLEKHWLVYTMTLISFLFATICNLVIIFNGQHVAVMTSDVINSCVNLEVDASKWIWIWCFTSQVLTYIFVIYKIIMLVQEYTVSESEVNAYLTMSVTRSLLPYIRTNLDVFPMVYPVIFVIQLYAGIACYLYLVLPVVIALIMNNLAAQWNFRLALLLGKIKASSPALRNIKGKLSYANMLHCHNVIRGLVRYYSSDAFPAVLTAFYCFTIFSICAILFRVSRLAGINFDRNATEIPELPKTSIDFINLKYTDSDLDAGVDASLWLWMNVGGFLVVSEIIGSVGLTIMEGGFFHLRRHGLIGCRTPHERRFVASLYQSLSARNPLGISPFNCFRVDRQFILTVTETIMILFTAMIQARMSVLITQPIYGLCDTGICIVGQASVNADLTLWTEQATEMLDLVTTTNIPPVQPLAVVLGARPRPTPPPAPPQLAPPPGVVCSRCKGTDIKRQTFQLQDPITGTMIPQPLPNNLLECVFKPYEAVLMGSGYFDVNGILIDKSPAVKDSCGNPKLPFPNSFPNPLSADFEVKVATSLFIREIDPITWIAPWPGVIFTAECYRWNSFSRSSTGVTLFNCHYPRLLSGFFCAASNAGMSTQLVESEVQNVNEYLLRKTVEVKPGLYKLNAQQNYIPNCDIIPEFQELLLSSGILQNNIGYAFSVPGLRVIRQVPITLIHNPDSNMMGGVEKWKHVSMFAEPKAIYLPYPMTNLLDTTKPGFYIDCAGYVMNEYDDCGLLPFTLDKRLPGAVSPVYERPKKIKVMYKDPATGDRVYVMCWEHQLHPDVQCGFLMTNPDFDAYIEKLCSTWESFQAGTLFDYLTSED